MNEAIQAIKKPILLEKLYQFPSIDKVIIESLEQALYRVEIEVDQQIYYIIESKGKSLTRRSIVEIQSLLVGFNIRSMFLRHVSPYDEMIGLESSHGDNELLVPLGNFFEGMLDEKRH